MKRLYRWHRRLSLIIALPVVLSAGSGFLHPIMTNMRPRVATQGLPAETIDVGRCPLPPSVALRMAGIDTISHLRLVHMDTSWFYQVRRGELDVPSYVSARTGQMLPKGDWLYAQYLARAFLEGTPGRAAAPSAPLPDCCTAATYAVLNAAGSPVTDEVRLTAFDEGYNPVNRLLPVYKVSFGRADGIRVYVETAQDRFALAVDNRRAAFNRVFEYIHTYQWLSFLGRGRLVAEALLLGAAFVTTVLGIWIFFATKSKPVPGNRYVRSRRLHRYTAIVVSLFTLMFTFSGAYHALVQLRPDDRDRFFARDRFATAALRLGPADWTRATDVSLVAIGGAGYWRLARAEQRPIASARKDLMRDMSAAQPPVVYIADADGAALPDGERRYARALAAQFSGRPLSAIKDTRCLTRFEGEYNFTDKRLPVWKVAYASDRYYVETSSGRLSVRVDDMDRAEAYSFALLHKHEFLGWAGKPVKDTSTMFWAAMQIVVVALGLTLYVRYRKRGVSKANGADRIKHS
ncbi:MAG TPA: PepSY domain-containing protein [Dinghuibacter sp.]|jgi:hypothetical protein|uniref:PepSY domain-containing protein n=1 Tax=Dinghuibacter sp. TaxID=2024697 RepID=UPI002C3E0DF2|nr:PepSY domain-containing protein [Dinghuibacter sp.]HTJ13030.1 PepSY domain-containing protein [Dinghuibacter sp.]